MQTDEGSFGLDQFSGLLPLFPLPGVVQFPCTLLPLHIFEPRYRAMVAGATSGEGVIGMVLLRPGWERAYNANPPIHEIACLGKIIETVALPDGRYNIVLCGVKRARVEAIVSDKPYRTARVELLDDLPLDGREAEAETLRDRLISVAHELPQPLFRHKNLAKALRRLDAPLGCTADLMADSLLLPPKVKQELLEELDPFARADALLRSIDGELRALPLAAAVPIRRGPIEPSRN